MTVTTDAKGRPARGAPGTTADEQKMKRRYKVGIVFLILLAISAASLGIHSNWLEGRWGASRSATDLAHALAKLPGVQSAKAAYNPVGVPESTVAVLVSFTADSTASDWARADQAVRSAAATAPLRESTTTATFTETAGRAKARVEPLLFTSAQVESEITAWRALRSATADRVSLRLGHSSAYTGTNAPLAREYTVSSAADMRAVADRWAATTHVPSSGIPTTWAAPGIQVNRFPTPALMRTVTALAKVAPLSPAHPDAKTTGTYAVVLSAARGYKVELMTFDHGKPADAAPGRVAPLATQAAFGSGASLVQEFSAGRLLSLTAGSCSSYASVGSLVTTSLVATPADQQFADDLDAVGYSRPADIHAGECQAGA